MSLERLIMHALIRRLKIQMLKARLALFRMERSALLQRLQSQQDTGTVDLSAQRRLEGLRDEMTRVELELAQLMGNGHA